MIIQIRGTSGSGKTTVARELMEAIGGWVPVNVAGRKRPLYYRNSANVVVLGHYEIDCGGCDTIGSAPKVFDTLQSIEYEHAITEGLLWSEDVKWTLELHKQQPDQVRCYFLITDTEECLRRVVQRQAGREPVDPARVRRKLSTRVGTIERARRRLVAAGVNCRRVSSTQASKVILKDLGYAK